MTTISQIEIHTFHQISNFIRMLGHEETALGEQAEDAAMRVVRHELFESVNSIQRLRTYMEYQVWCVWDFMSIAKSIQHRINPQTMPWIPPDDPESVAL
ncbi:MAG: DUF3050 domain-containing protein, partial [Planctomycetota bacterium]